MSTFKEKAEKAINKEAAIGLDVDLEEYDQDSIDQHEKIDSLSELNKKDQEVLQSVGVEPDEENRSASFLQKDQTPVFENNMYDGVEIMSVPEALEKHDWLSDYLWTAVQVDADKYTAKAELGELGGYFIRAEPGVKLDLPVQACMFIGDRDTIQTAHNIIIAEENSRINIINGCSTASHVDSAAHIGVSEFFLKKGSTINFTMVHNWDNHVDVRPRTGVILEDDATYVSNYILAKPVENIQAYPTAYCNGKNSRAFFQSILEGHGDSIIDQGSRTILTGENSSSEMITRAISHDESTIYTRGDMHGVSPHVKGHIECMGLVLSENSKIYSVPELKCDTINMELSHEAAVGKIAEDQIQYLTARGLTEEEATSMIVRGFFDIDIKGLPEELARTTKKLIDLSMEGS
ncbi:MAG: SufD family Fe-S cluster assembly protein [Methanosphaera stadtmanae]|jgi:hypothetical protein|nr:SufD family Fe-S cluster assembly protein [Methanosphaera stadtmanae]